MKNRNEDYVSVVTDAANNLISLLKADPRFVKMTAETSGGYVDKTYYLQVEDSWEIVGQVAYEDGKPIQDGSAWFDASDFNEQIKEYSDILDKEQQGTQ